MTTEQVGAYIRLLCYQWQQGEIPDDPDRLSRIAGCSVETINLVVSKFAKVGTGLRNPRLEMVREIQQKWRESRFLNGKKGGRPRKNSREGKPTRNLVVCEKQNGDKPSANHMESERETESASAFGVTLLPLEVESQIRKLYRRRDSTDWSKDEIKSAKMLSVRSEKDLLDDLILFRDARAKGWVHHRQDIVTLLNNWNQDVERASSWIARDQTAQRFKACTPPPNMQSKTGLVT